jgi:hypothetical protein
MSEDDAEDASLATTDVRTDGKSIDIDGDYTETLARIDANPNGIGVFGLAFYENNTDKLKVATMSGVSPSTETIASGEYPVSRPLFFYVKKAHIGVIPGMKEYAQFFVSDEIAGPDGPLAVRPGFRPGAGKSTFSSCIRRRISSSPPYGIRNSAADRISASCRCCGALSMCRSWHCWWPFRSV